VPPDEEFLHRFGDVIDDRIAETLDELIQERAADRRPRRWPLALGCTAFALALVTSALLPIPAITTWAVWPMAAALCLVAGAAARA
jgi:hypothetical protein